MKNKPIINFCLFSATKASGVEEPGKRKRQRQRWRRRFHDTNLRAPAGRWQYHHLFPEYRKLHPMHQGEQGSLAARCHAQHASIHVRHEELPGNLLNKFSHSFQLLSLSWKRNMNNLRRDCALKVGLRKITRDIFVSCGTFQASERKSIFDKVPSNTLTSFCSLLFSRKFVSHLLKNFSWIFTFFLRFL